MRSSFYIIIIWSFLTLSCDPCNECGEPLNYEPTVALTIINQDSIDALNNQISITNNTVSYYDSISLKLNNEIDSLGDELVRINDSIAAGITGYSDSLGLVEDALEELNLEFLPLELKLNELDSIVDLYNEVIKTINSGSILVEKVTVLNNGAEITYSDSMNVFNLPLLMDQSQTDYRIKILNKEFTLSLSYQTQETLDEARVFRVIATNILLEENYTFDTLIITCRDDICISNETSLTAYY